MPAAPPFSRRNLTSRLIIATRLQVGLGFTLQPVTGASTHCQLTERQHRSIPAYTQPVVLNTQCTCYMQKVKHLPCWKQEVTPKVNPIPIDTASQGCQGQTQSWHMSLHTSIIFLLPNPPQVSQPSSCCAQQGKHNSIKAPCTAT